MKQIPNIFTLLNLFFGCLAILYAMQFGLQPLYQANGTPWLNEMGTQYVSVREEIWFASLFIALAGIVDFLDGFVARLFKATSEIGKQLDSLADVVSFGVAPAMILYQFLRLSIAQQEDGLDTSLLWLLPAFILPCAGAYRLAKFNIDTTQQYYFKGVPIPAVGLLVASLPLIYWNTDNQVVISVLLNKWVLIGTILLLSYLMVSNIPMLSLKFKSFSVKDNIPKIILIVISISAVLLLKWVAVPVIFIAYVLVSLIFKKQLA